jgi:hypothetical protein
MMPSAGFRVSLKGVTAARAAMLERFFGFQRK